MVEIGYALSSEEHRPQALVEWARQAEAAGFSFAIISDHFHPWIDRQGQSPFVWAVLGGIAQVTERLRVGTGVTAPAPRYHPAIVAQAAATVSAMMPERFFLGVGTGEHLNEHIVGERWPAASVRRAMLAEAVEVIRKLWTGKLVTHHGIYFTVENARLYTLPDVLPPLVVAAAGPAAARLAGEIGDGLISVAPKPELVEAFREARGAAGQDDRPRYGQMTVCWAPSEAAARKIAHEWWPNAGLKGEVTAELPLPHHFEQAVATVREEDVAESIICGPDPEQHIAGIRQFLDAGFDAVYVHQVGPDQTGFFRFYEAEILPAFR